VVNPNSRRRINSSGRRSFTLLRPRLIGEDGSEPAESRSRVLLSGGITIKLIIRGTSAGFADAR
jgi:hypothetical protein